MGIQKKIIGVLLGMMCFVFNTPTQAQQPYVRKDIRKFVEGLPEAKRNEVFVYADSLLSEYVPGETIIADEKTFYKSFRLLPESSQEELWAFIQRQVSKPDLEAGEAPGPYVGQQASDSLIAEEDPGFWSPVFEERAQPQHIQQASALPKTHVEWKNDIIDFGSVVQGTLVTQSFIFVNTGTEQLVLTRVEGSCGCTRIKWENKPVEPGQEGRVEVTFDSRGRLGPQYKTLSVTLNTSPIFKVLQLKGEVVLPAKP